MKSQRENPDETQRLPYRNPPSLEMAIRQRGRREGGD